MLVQSPQEGICVPSTCSDNDIMKAYNELLKEIQEPIKAYGAIQIVHLNSYEKDSHGTITQADAFCM